MAVDTRNRRASCLSLDLPLGGPLPAPDGAGADTKEQRALLAYVYAGQLSESVSGDSFAPQHESSGQVALKVTADGVSDSPIAISLGQATWTIPEKASGDSTALMPLSVRGKVLLRLEGVGISVAPLPISNGDAPISPGIWVKRPDADGIWVERDAIVTTWVEQERVEKEPVDAD